MNIDDNKSTFNELISGFLSESLSKNQQAVLFEEINQNRESKRIYINQIKKLLLSESSMNKQVDKERIFRKIKKEIKTTRRKIVMAYAGKVTLFAALFLLVFGLGFYFKTLFSSDISPAPVITLAEDIQNVPQNELVQNTEIVVPRGSRTQIVLPDGSKVWINSDSKISYSVQYAQSNRDVYLEGEAFFEVAKDTGLLFRVFSGDVSITATGTSFNVDAYSSDIKTTLLEGSVEVASKGGKSRRLKPNQSIVFDKALSDFHIVNSVKTELISSWKDERWIVRAMNLEEFANKLEKRYNIRIFFSDESIKQNKISATLTTETVEQVMQALKASMNLNYFISKNEITIYRQIPL